MPLARLFAMGYRWMVDALHSELDARGWQQIRPAFGFGLLALRAGPMTPTQLGATLGVTKQAASKLAEAMGEAGIVASGPDPADGRRQVLALTDRGHALLADVEGIYVELEARWARAMDAPDVEPLRRHLTRALTDLHGGSLPAVRPPT